MEKADFDKRIKEGVTLDSWYDEECGRSFTSVVNPTIDYEGLELKEQVALYIYSWSKIGYVIFKKAIVKEFNISKYMVAKIVKLLGDSIGLMTAIDDHTGLLMGRGYTFNKF